MKPRWKIVTRDVAGEVVDTQHRFFHFTANAEAARTNLMAHESSLYRIGREYGLQEPPWHATVERLGT